MGFESNEYISLFGSLIYRTHGQEYLYFLATISPYILATYGAYAIGKWLYERLTAPPPPPVDLDHPDADLAAQQQCMWESMQEYRRIMNKNVINNNNNLRSETGQVFEESEAVTEESLNALVSEVSPEIIAQQQAILDDIHGIGSSPLRPKGFFSTCWDWIISLFW